MIQIEHIEQMCSTTKENNIWNRNYRTFFLFHCTLLQIVYVLRNLNTKFCYNFSEMRTVATPDATWVTQEAIKTHHNAKRSAHTPSCRHPGWILSKQMSVELMANGVSQIKGTASDETSYMDESGGTLPRFTSILVKSNQYSCSAATGWSAMVHDHRFVIYLIGKRKVKVCNFVWFFKHTHLTV